MFAAINEQFNKKKRNASEDEEIVESVLGVDEVLPGSEDEMDDQVDADSVPDDVVNKIDAELEKIVSAPDYDDTEADEMIDDEDDDFSDEEIDAVITEACNAWYDPEHLGHPNTKLREGGKDGQYHQPIFHGNGQKPL